MLTNSLKILDTTKREFFKLKSFHNVEKIWQNFLRADSSSALEPLATLFAVCNIWYAPDMEIIFFV